MSWIKKINIPQALYAPSWFYKSSWIPDKVDDRDFMYSSNSELFVPIEVSKIVSLKKWCSPVETQKHHGSCVGNAATNAIELNRIRDGLEHVDFSRMFVYYNSRIFHSAVLKDEGTQIRYALSSINGIGVCRTYLWPYVSENINKRPSWNAYREAYKTRISAYYSIKGDYTEIIEQIEHAIRSGNPVLFGCLVYSDFCSGKLQKGGIARIPGDDENYVGGHAMLIVGFDSERRLLEVKNSWGIDWANNGYCWIPYDYLKPSRASDFWVLTAEFK